MSAKDLLAAMAMILPSLILIVLIAIALLPPARLAAPPPGAGFERNSAGKDVYARTGMKGHRAAGDASARAGREIATQDMIRDFWGRPYCASCAQVMETARCNSSARDDDRSCF